MKKIIERLTEQKKDFINNIDEWKEIKSKYKSYRERFESLKEIDNQIVEWYLLDLIDEDFNPKEILHYTLLGFELNPKYQFLPIDTKYFKDLELEILELFDNLDDELDGYLIRARSGVCPIWTNVHIGLGRHQPRLPLGSLGAYH